MFLNKLKRLRYYYLKSFGLIDFDKYDKKGAFHWNHYEELSWYRMKVDYLLSKIQPSVKKYLDIGCGDGLLVYQMSKNIKKSVGIDISPSGIKYGVEKLIEKNALNAELHCYNILEFAKKFKDEQFDLITCIDVIEHIFDDKKFIKELAELNIYSKDCRIYIGTPIFINKSLVSNYHYREYTLDQIRNLISSKFKILDEKLFDDLRKDGIIYKNNYYIAECIVKTNMR